MLHLFGPNPLLWFFPICNTTGDGWAWEPSPKWLEARSRLGRERNEQRERERAAGWGSETPLASPAPWTQPSREGVGRHYLVNHPQPIPSPSPTTSSSAGDVSSGWQTPSKADRVLGRDPNLYADEVPASVSLRRLSPMASRPLRRGGADGADDLDSARADDDDDETVGLVRAASTAEAEQRSLNIVSNGGWERSGASGLLRKPSKPNLQASGLENHDDGVD